MKRKLLTVFLLLGLVLPGFMLAGPTKAAPEVKINEIRIDQPSTDIDEYFELSGIAGESLDGLTYLVIGDGSGGSGVIEAVVNLDGNSIDSNGFFVTAENTFTLGTADLTTDLNFENSDNVTHMLVRNFTGSDGDDLDANDDGTLDETPWSEIVDSVALIETVGSGDLVYSTTTVGPDGSFVPGQVFLCENGWQIGSFDPTGGDDTPGVENNCTLVPVVDCGSSLSTPEGYATSQEISASDADGIVTEIAITDINPPTVGITLSDLIPASEVGGNATATLNVAATTAPGNYTVEITASNNDTPAQTGTCTLSITVVEILSIGEVQGSVSDSDNGLTHASPYVGQTVAIQGVIYEKTLARTSSGGSNFGFFIQNTAVTADGDPNSADGIFVFMSRFTDLIGGYAPQVGDEVIIQARVSEFFNLTELSGARALDVLRSGVDLNSEVPAFEVNPPSELADANRYWERHEGMRAQVPAGSIVLNGRDVFASTMDGEVWVARGDTEIAGRSDPYTRRSFRDAHPLDDIPGELFDNGNGYRIVMGSLGIKATEDDINALIAPSRTFDTLTNAPIGGVYFSFGKYQIQVEQQLDLEEGVDPSLNAPPQTFDRSEAYSLATFNVENLYDYRDDPFDGCDFTGDSGCPGVSPPFDYVPVSDAAYQDRLHEIAGQIINDLHNPDIIMAQEAEDQDICTVTDSIFSCGDTNNADGKPDTLQELATVIASMGGPLYDAAYDRDGADDRGIISAYLYRTDRVELLPAMEDNPVLGSEPTVDYRGISLAYNTDVQNPKALNAVLPADVDRNTGVDGENVFTRPPQVGLFRVWRNGIGTSVFTDLYVLDNHFSSGPDSRVGQRTEQANYNAAIVAALQLANPQVNVSVGGDLNVFPRPDDPFMPGDPLFPSDQLAALYEQGLTNLYDILVAEIPTSAYSYVFQGQAQTLDQIFMTPVLLDDLVQIRAAHINSDWPSDFDGDGPRGTSDHDPQNARLSVLPTLNRLEGLVHYYDLTGTITGNNTARILLDRLERAARFQERDQEDAYEDQLLAFISQVRDFTPQFIEPFASDALVNETELLLMQP